jgi:hypothetical protein
MTNLKILVCGTAAWLMGIAEGLRTVDGLVVECVDPCLLKHTSRIIAMAPDVVIIERGTWDWMAIHRHPEFPVIELDAAQSASLVRDTRPILVHNLNDLVQAIRQVTHADVDAVP